MRAKGGEHACAHRVWRCAQQSFHGARGALQRLPNMSPVHTEPTCKLTLSRTHSLSLQHTGARKTSARRADGHSATWQRLHDHVSHGCIHAPAHGTPTRAETHSPAVNEFHLGNPSFYASYQTAKLDNPRFGTPVSCYILTAHPAHAGLSWWPVATMASWHVWMAALPPDQQRVLSKTLFFEKK
jgi:hypothetical protein